MSRLLIPRVLATGSLMTSATAVRLGVVAFQLSMKYTPPLTRSLLRASMGGSPGARAEAAFRDEYLGLARETAEVIWREMRAGVDDLDSLTRPGDDLGDQLRRPWRVKP